MQLLLKLTWENTPEIKNYTFKRPEQKTCRGKHQLNENVKKVYVLEKKDKMVWTHGCKDEIYWVKQ